jgi:hypothetical protein
MVGENPICIMSDSMQMSVCQVKNFLMQTKCSILDNPDLGPGVMVCCDKTVRAIDVDNDFRT